MTRWTLRLSVAALLAAGCLLGCESDAPPEETAEFDPTIDAPPTNLVATPESGLVADQGRLAQASAAAVRTTRDDTGSDAAAPSVTNKNITDVREIMDGLIESGKTGQMSAVLQYLQDDDAEQMRSAIGALAKLSTQATEFEKAVKEILALEAVPASIKQALNKGEGGGPMLASLGDLSPDMLEYSSDGSTVTVKDMDRELTFTKVGETWKIDLSDADTQRYAALADLAETQAKFVQTLTDGIKDGAITQHNIDEKGMALMEEMISPAMQKYKDAASGAGAAPAAPAGGGDAAPAGGAPADLPGM